MTAASSPCLPFAARDHAMTLVGKDHVDQLGNAELVVNYEHDPHRLAMPFPRLPIRGWGALCLSARSRP